ncbi:MAG: PCMD domain-containing protein [Bacteroidales bacterium]|nr:PCMD domain-containing protein [Bacteroidales bacterium]
MVKRWMHIALCGMLAVSCFFPNDLDYPQLVGAIVAFEVEDAKEVRIDAAAREVSIVLEEWADMSHVKVTSFEMTEKATCDDIGEWLDLTQPVKAVLHTYQDYEWTITATQPIERYVRCAGQAQEAQFNMETRSVYVYMPDTKPLSSVTFEAMKLEPEGSRIVSTTGYESDLQHLTLTTRAVSFPMTLDCITERSFFVEWKGEVIEWRLKALQLKVSTAVSEVDAHCYSARVRGVFASDGSDVGVEYKKADESTWTAAAEVSVSGVGLTARLTGLTPKTAYECRVRDGEEVSAPMPFETGEPVQPANLNFDAWHANGKVWNPWEEGGVQVWDSANKATASFTGSATMPDDSFVAVSGEGKKACRMESSYAVVKFAAGSVFTGQFVKLQGLGAELAWGLPFTAKPVSLKGSAAYKSTPITDTDDAHAALKGQPDTGHILIALTDWADQFHVVSSNSTYVDFDNDPAIIAYGRYALSETTDGYVPFDIPLTYRSDRTPRYLVIVASSSALGDYFTGGRGSTLWVDEFALVYD